MKLTLLKSFTTTLVVSLLILCTADAQVTKSTFTFGAPNIINIKKIAEYEKNHPVILTPRFIEQGEDRDKFIFKPGPVDKNAKVHQVAQTNAANQVRIKFTCCQPELPGHTG